ncbi:MAG: ImmA/IrrE family metallo-endopeptidase [Deltaproteobacteria bacterium]|nr:ImmA/IrrE family metallo-endopeptidase [Deltaproteobacteria bacterium]
MTTDRVLGLRRAEALARAMNKRWGVRAPADIQIEKFAAARGVQIVEGGVTGAMARLCWGPRPIIRVSELVADPAEQKWCTCHELAHLICKHPPDEIDHLCKHERPYKPPRAGVERHYEAEANVFTAELMMPRDQLSKRCEIAAPSLEIAYAIAKDFMTPIAASAIRFVELTPERCCVVYSERGKVVWAVPSTTFSANITRGARLDRRSVAFDWHDRQKLDDRAQPIVADAWLSTHQDVEIVEHSAPLATTNGVITLLWVPEAVAPQLKMAS